MTTNFDRELTETELDQVVGGDTALQHEGVHADQYRHPVSAAAVGRSR